MRLINGIKMYSTADIAKLFGVGEATVTNYRRNGRIKATRIGRSYYFSETALNEYLEGRLAFEKEKAEIGKLVN